MNLGSRVVGSMSLPGSTASRKSGEVLEFPAGLRVLVVDDDPTCLTILEKMLRTCRYEGENLAPDSIYFPFLIFSFISLVFSIDSSDFICPFPFCCLKLHVFFFGCWIG